MRVKLAVEVKPVGTAFDGLNLQKTTDWTDIGTAGLAMTKTITGLTANRAYHWRARVLYEPTLTMGATHSRWYYGGALGRQGSTHVRTL
jgi:hypothetical protein